MIRLATLGPTELLRDPGEEIRPILVQPKRLGLLVYLAVEAPDRFVRRDSLLALFWPELDQGQARQALRTALYFLRQHLGDQVLVSRGADEVGVDTAFLDADVVAFRAAADRGDAAAALNLYRGDFLAGLHLAEGSPELDQWTAAIRTGLRHRAATLAWAEAERLEPKNPVGAAHWARRAHEIEQDDEASLRRLMETLDRVGDAGGALRAFEEFAERLRTELAVAPSAESRGLAARLRVKRPTPGPLPAMDPPQLRPSRTGPVPSAVDPVDRSPPVGPGGALAVPPVAGRSPRPRRNRYLLGAAATAIVLVAAAAAALATRALVDREPTAAPAARVEGPIVVGELVNETGDTALAIWGRYAGDWITEGLQAAGPLPVVPWSTALRASRQADSAARKGPTDPVLVLSRETGARTVITGAFYRVSDSIRFRADISMAPTGRLLWSVAVAAARPDSVEAAIGELRDRILGGIGLSADPRFAGSPRLDRRPPRFQAFVAYERGTRLYDGSRYAAAVAEFERAFALDSLFLSPLLSALNAEWNMSRYDRVDTLIRLLAARRGALTEPQELSLRWVEARLRGDGLTALEVRRRAALIAPHTAASYNLALVALQMNRPDEAIAALVPLRANESYVNRWAPFWIYLAHANHLVGRYDDALAAVAELSRRFPDRTVALALEAASLAALGRAAAIDSLIAREERPPDTYWSTGAALVIAGQELAAHGFPDLAARYLERADGWLREHLARDPANREHREWLVSASYNLRRWDEAARLATELGRELPDRQTFRLIPALVAARSGDTVGLAARLGEATPADAGNLLAARARVAAAMGDADGAVALLTEALARTVPTFHWAHSDWWIDFAEIGGDSRVARLLTIRRRGSRAPVRRFGPRLRRANHPEPPGALPHRHGVIELPE